MPSAKCFCAASSLMFANASTTMERGWTLVGRRAVAGGVTPRSRTTSKLQARTSAMGNPSSSRTVVNVTVQGGRLSAGRNTEATWTSSHPTTA